MFEPKAGNEEKDRSRSVMILSGIAVTLVVVLIILVTSFRKHASPLETARPGSAEFESYAQFIKLNNIEKRHGERLNNRYGRITCTVENAGESALSALQLRAAAIDLGDVVVREKIITPVPNMRETLGPNQSMAIDLYIEPIPDPSSLKDMIIEVHGLKVK
ncbi:MAG TPA: hypothetical protein VLE20_07660 [Blastocatellia bacterium]|jgi:flagellar basal body-associated protein FliL|nr:hypothetical protein [Blastocatellia bacterium]